MTGRRPPDASKLQLAFGAYAQVVIENDPTNTMIPRPIGTIQLGPSGNTQGANFFMNINTGRRLHVRSWTALPMPDDVIERVDELGHKQTMPNMVNVE